MYLIIIGKVYGVTSNQTCRNFIGFCVVIVVVEWRRAWWRGILY